MTQQKSEERIVPKGRRKASPTRGLERRVYEGRKSLWALSHDAAVHRGLRNAYFAARGLMPLKARFEAIWAPIPAPRQLELFAEPERS